VKLSVLAMMLFACAATRSKPMGPWTIEVTSSGGLAGRGAGSYTVDSTGNVSVVTMARKSCTFRATDADVDRIASLLAEAKPESWSPSYKPKDLCCDRFEYTMTITEGESKRTVEWIDDPPPMPADLTAIIAAMMGGEESVRVKYGAQCR